MGATRYATRVVLTDKAKALFRERRIKNSNTLVTDILWLASAEFGRQRSEGFVMQPSDLDGPLAKMWAPK